MRSRTATKRPPIPRCAITSRLPSSRGSSWIPCRRTLISRCLAPGRMDVAARNVRLGQAVRCLVPVKGFEHQFRPRLVDREDPHREIEEHHRYPLHQLFVLRAPNGDETDQERDEFRKKKKGQQALCPVGGKRLKERCR